MLEKNVEVACQARSDVASQTAICQKPGRERCDTGRITAWLGMVFSAPCEARRCTDEDQELGGCAGSERVARSEVAGQALKEAGAINRSLAALGDVVSALQRRAQHVPFRNSRLTQVIPCPGMPSAARASCRPRWCPGVARWHVYLRGSMHVAPRCPLLSQLHLTHASASAVAIASLDTKRHALFCRS